MKKVILLLCLLPVFSFGQKKVAITFDDLPFVGAGNSSVEYMEAMNRQLLAQFAAYGMPVTGFVNEKQIAERDAPEARLHILRLWLEAGHELGNHTYSHPKLFNTPLLQFQEEVLKGEQLSRPLMEAFGKKMRYFRHPYSNTGPTAEVKNAFEAFLEEKGYQVAPHTIESSDWLFNAVYAKAKQKGDTATMKKVGEEYIRQTALLFDYFEERALALVDRPVAHIYLCHANDLNADYIDELGAMMQQKGYEFISLEEALKDEVYQLSDHFVGNMGPSWLHRWSTENMQDLLRQQPDLSAEIYQLYEQYQKQ